MLTALGYVLIYGVIGGCVAVPFRVADARDPPPVLIVAGWPVIVLVVAMVGCILALNCLGDALHRRRK